MKLPILDSWKRNRLVLHWITLPLKLLVIGGLGYYQIVKNYLIAKKRKPVTTERPLFKARTILDVLQKLPVLKAPNFHLYTPRVPFGEVPNKYNHNTDHQCARHGTYAFLMHKLGLHNQAIDQATMMHIQNPFLCRGYSWNYYENDTMNLNIRTVSGDMLCGLNLAALVTDDALFQEKYEQLVLNIIDNDYSLLEGASPGKGEPGDALYDEQLKRNAFRPEAVRLKSLRGMWQPGVETVGAQALTILATLKLSHKRFGSRDAGEHYTYLFKKCGYGLLSLFPTAYIDSKRGYFNDHNCMISLYILNKLAETSFEKWVYRKAMKYVWLLSKHWYNAYFTGLLKEVYPEAVSDDYIKKCQEYVYENDEIRLFGYRDSNKIKIPEVPVNYNYMEEDEFSPDVDKSYQNMNYSSEMQLYRTGLGWLADAIMIETDKSVLETVKILKETSET
jgi:hypothetical protein